ncbi:hypothetical protein RCF68_09585, partial [Staphylococcus felis]
IVPQILKNCEVMPKTLHAKHRLSRLLNKYSGFEQNGMASKIASLKPSKKFFDLFALFFASSRNIQFFKKRGKIDAVFQFIHHIASLLVS